MTNLEELTFDMEGKSYEHLGHAMEHWAEMFYDGYVSDEYGDEIAFILYQLSLNFTKKQDKEFLQMELDFINIVIAVMGTVVVWQAVSTYRNNEDIDFLLDHTDKLTEALNDVTAFLTKISKEAQKKDNYDE